MEIATYFDKPRTRKLSKACVVAMLICLFSPACGPVKKGPPLTSDEWYPYALFTFEYKIAEYYCKTGKWPSTSEALFGPRGFEFYCRNEGRWSHFIIPLKSLRLEKEGNADWATYELHLDFDDMKRSLYAGFDRRSARKHVQDLGALVRNSRTQYLSHK